ncbi:MAG: Fe-S cluster assembly protein SufD [Xanthomonadales bacterium]|jgi:Fe-S cluster assembly protein SufD|nr:Fe-S cluster assembly protein SufD [Xanthomonadales bacterium]
MSGLLEPLIANAAAAQRDALQALRLPASRDERWRYSSLRALNQRQFAAAPRAAATISVAMQERLRALPARIVFVDGQFDTAHSDLSALGDDITLSNTDPVHAPPPHWPFALAAAASARTLGLRIAANTALPQPLHLVALTTAAAQDAIVQQSLRLELGAGAEASFVHHRFTDGDSSAFVNAWRDIDIGTAATLHWLEVADEGAGVSSVLGTRATLAEKSQLYLAEVAAGASLYRHEVDVTLAGEHAQLCVRGCAMVGQRRHADLHIDVRHRARNTRSDMVWRGLADQRGHAIFAGQLIVEAGADGADAALSNKNLLLSAHAEIDTRPVLEIHADEVKAAHGATVGRLDERSLFYLRSRGIAEPEARRILQLAFAREPLLQLSDATVRETALAALARCLPEDAA